MLTGILLIGWDGLLQPAGERAWLGDLLFFASSVLWAGFTLLLRHWRLPALQATAVVVVLSCVMTTPIYLATMGIAHLQALPLGMLAVQGLVQGGLQGAITMSPTARRLSSRREPRGAVPALVPALSVLVGIRSSGRSRVPCRSAASVLSRWAC